MGSDFVPMGSDWVPIGSDVVRLGPMGSDWVISHTRENGLRPTAGRVYGHFGAVDYTADRVNLRTYFAYTYGQRCSQWHQNACIHS